MNASKWNSGIAAVIAAVITMGTVAMTAAPASASDLSQALGLDNNNRASARQTDKNNMRNLGIGLGAAAAYELLKGKTTTGLVLGAGAAYAAKKYDDERKAQAKDAEYDRYDRYNHYERNDRRDHTSYRTYRYQNGERIGYDQYENGRRVSYYERQRNGDNWTDRYSKKCDY